jgi:hypothetical protein
MRRNVSAARVIACLFVSSAWGAGCSLVNSFGDVEPQKAPADAATPVPEAAEPETSPGVVDAAPVPEAGDSGANVDAVGAAIDAGVDAGPRGVIVVGGTVSDDASEHFVLTALDPVTGSELPQARETLAVAAVFYDGRRDLWYVFESGGQDIFPLPSDPFFLHTRQLDPLSGAWTEIGKVAVPPGLSFGTTGILGERVSYIAYAAADAGALVDGATAPFELVTLDTTNPAAVTVSSTMPLAAPPVAVVGTRSPVNPAGGFATLADVAQNGPARVARLTPVLLPATAPPSLEAPILGATAVGGQTGFGAVSIGGVEEIAVITRAFGAPATPATVSVYNPAANDPSMALVGTGTFAFGDGNIKPPAFSTCDQTLFVIGSNADLDLHAVSLASAAAPDPDAAPPELMVTSAPTGHSGQAVYFEPFTSTVLVPFSQGNNFALTAFSFEDGQLVQRQAPRWVPPPDVRPNFVATRIPVPFLCPTPSH